MHPLLLLLLFPFQFLLFQSLTIATSSPSPQLLRGDLPSPPTKTTTPPPGLLPGELNQICKHHAELFNITHRTNMQLTLDLFFSVLDVSILPIGGTLLGTIRDRMLCSVWDDDIDFSISSKEYDLLLKTPVGALKFSDAAPDCVEDISDTDLGQSLEKYVMEGDTCFHKGWIKTGSLCNKVTTLRVIDPSKNTLFYTKPTSKTSASMLFADYFRRNKQSSSTKQVCLSLVFLRFGFAKVLVHPECSHPKKKSYVWKVTDLFPASFDDGFALDECDWGKV